MLGTLVMHQLQRYLFALGEGHRLAIGGDFADKSIHGGAVEGFSRAAAHARESERRQQNNPGAQSHGPPSQVWNLKKWKARAPSYEGPPFLPSQGRAGG